MGAVARARDIGAFLLVEVSNKPNAVAAGTRNSTGFDRTDKNLPESAVLYASSGPVTGAPSAQTLNAKVQHSDDNSVWSDYTPPKGVAAITQVTAANTQAVANVDLSSAKRYVRVQEVVGFTGGTSPTLGAVSGLVFGGFNTHPTV